MVHWTLADDVRALARARAALDDGKPMPLALREARVWGAKEKLFERALPLLSAQALAAPGDGRQRLRRHRQGPEAPASGRSIPGAPCAAWC